jgi:protein SCO1/2
MEKPKSKVEWLVWVVMGGTILAIGVAFLLELHPSGPRLPVLFEKLPPFALTNQAGEIIGNSTLQDQVWVADVIFTRCAGLCATLTKQMGQLQAALPAGAPIKLVSLTADPEYDSAERLRRYADQAGAGPGRWQFLTGDKKQIYELAVDGLKFVVRENTPGERQSDADLFLHSERFVLVDKKGRVRAYYDGTDTNSIPQIVSAAKRLMREN